jgi:hypothetical protein
LFSNEEDVRKPGRAAQVALPVFLWIADSSLHASRSFCGWPTSWGLRGGNFTSFRPLAFSNSLRLR